MSVPYYKDEQVTLYRGDCREITAWLEADILVTDPPYGMAFVSHKPADRRAFADMIAGDTSTGVRDAVLNMWGSHRISLVFTRDDLPTAKPSIRLVWEKGQHVGMGNLDIPWRPSIERIDVSGRWPERQNTGRGGNGRTSPVLRHLAPTARTTTAGAIHPFEKPVSLLEALIHRCPPGVIADPFAGSGSTLVAARNLGRRAIGVEIEERYCEAAAKRLSQGVLDFEDAS